MAEIKPTDKPVFWALENAGQIGLTGMTEIGAVTQTAAGKTVYSDADENAFLGKAAGKAGSYRPLPPVGTWMEAGDIYGYNGGLLIVRQSHYRMNYAPEDTPALFCVYRHGATGSLEWVSGERVYVGTRRSYGDKVYEALQEHVTQSDWTPPAVPALWREVVETPPAGEWAVGVAYKIGDIVTYQGKTYQCIQAHTAQAGWTPPVVPALWKAL